MNLQVYFNMSREDLAFALKTMPAHKLKALNAAIAANEARTHHAIVPTVLPAYMIAGGKTIAFDKQTMSCRASVCRAPHKNRR